jgi:hypothetical protein
MADKIGASPAERKRITSDRMSKSKKLKNLYKDKSKPKGAGTPRLIKGGKGESDSARLARMKKESKEFNKTLTAKKIASQKQEEAKGNDIFAGIRKSLTNDKYKKQKPVSQVQKKDAKTLSKGGPKMGFTPKAFGIKGAPGPAGKKLKRMSSGGTVKTSSYYSSGGKVFTGR